MSKVIFALVVSVACGATAWSIALSDGLEVGLGVATAYIMLGLILSYIENDK